MKLPFACAAILCCACGVDLTRPDGISIVCARDAECPEGYRCSEAIGFCREGPVGDTEGPSLQEVVAKSETSLVLSFDEELVPRGVDELDNYAIVPALTVLGASLLEDGQRIALTVDGQLAGVEYALVVSNLIDLDGNSIRADHNSQTFIGFGTVPDRSPPEILAPAPDEVVKAGSVRFVWSGRVGAASYVLEVFRYQEDGVTEMPVVAPIVVAAPSTAHEVALSEPRTHYWRVRANTTDGSTPVASFELVDGSLRVFCPVGQTSTCAMPPAQVESGNLDTPFASLQRALDAAEALNIDQVLVASHVGSDLLEYQEEVLIPAGVDLLGGYDASFSDTNRQLELASQITSVSGPSMLVGAPASATLIEAISFTSNSYGSNASIALWIVNANSNLRLSRCRVSAEGAGVLHVGLRISASKADVPLVENSTIIATHGDPSHAVEVDGGGARLAGNTIETSESTMATGIRAVNSPTLHLENNDIRVIGRPGIDNSFAGIDLDDCGDGRSSPARVIDNRIVTGPANNNSYGLRLGHFVNAEVRGNKIYAGDSATSYALLLENVAVGRYDATADTPPQNSITNNLLWTGSSSQGFVAWSVAGIRISMLTGSSVYPNLLITHNTIVVGNTSGTAVSSGIYIQGGAPSITNNVIFLRLGSATTYAIYEAGDEADPRSVQNNVFGGSLTAHYFNEGTTSDNSLDGLDGEQLKYNGEQSRYSSNRDTTLLIDELFVNPDASDPATADWSLKLAAGSEWIQTWGKSTSTPDCGTVQRPFSCGGSWVASATDWQWQQGVADDLDHHARTAPVSAGAWEKDQ